MTDLVCDYLIDTFVTLADHSRLMRDPAWLRQLNARELAMLHGQTFDRAARILEVASE